jgi:hypothetical protein
MDIRLILITTTLALFFMAFLVLGAWTYKKGIEAGMSINKKDIIPDLLKPVSKTSKTLKKDDDEIDKIQQGINNIFAYDGEVKPDVNGVHS